jgi:putative transcriptional regulator
MPTRNGQLLIATSPLKDPNFHRTVVLIVRDDENGTFGLVLNRPLDTTVKEATAEALDGECPVEAPLHLGGPCEGMLTVLHSQKELGEVEVMPGVHFTQGRDMIEQLMRDDPKPAKYFVGYSGWSAGQLDGEMEGGAWILTPADKALIFDNPEAMWNRIITQVTIGKLVDVDRMPDDPSVN